MVVPSAAATKKAQEEKSAAQADKASGKRSRKAGLAPGTLVYIGEQHTQPVKITVIDYDDAKVEEKPVEAIEHTFPFKETASVSWINIDGIHKVDTIEKVGKHFDLHPLLLEDIANTQQRPKLEDFDGYLFFVLKMLSFDAKENRIKAKQVSLILGPAYVISFQESEGDVFDPVRERIRQNKGRIRKSGPDFLAYSLIDAIVDSYFAILEQIGDKIEELEVMLVKNSSTRTLQEIYRLKREMIDLRKALWPMREVVAQLERGESPLIHKHTMVYLRDIYDHTVAMIDTVETYRDTLSGMIDIYLSSQSNKMNEIMKVLTIITTIFIPITFVASIYGMNFHFMPELDNPQGYPTVIVIMVIMTLVMLGFFRSKRWI